LQRRPLLGSAVLSRRGHETLRVSETQRVLSQGHLWYDPHGSVLTSTLPVTLTEQLLSAQGLDSRLGLVYHGDGRWYDPTIAHTLQPDPFGGVPQLPQTLNRYRVTGWKSPGWETAIANPSLSPVPTTVGKKTASGLLGLGLSAYARPSGFLNVTANLAVVRRAGYTDFFQRVAPPGRGRSAQFVSSLLREVDEGVYEVLEGAWAGRRIAGETLEEALESVVVSNRWPVSGFGFEAIDDTVLRQFLRSGRAVDFGLSFAIDAMIDLPFFYHEVIANPYLTIEQKRLRGWIQVGEWTTGAVVGLYVGGVPGVVAGVVTVLVYNHILVPLLIRPIIIQRTGTDPYHENRNLRPLQ